MIWREMKASEAVWGGMIKDSSSLSVPHKPLQERLDAPRDYFDHYRSTNSVGEEMYLLSYDT